MPTRTAVIAAAALAALTLAAPLGALADEAQRDRIAAETAALRGLPALPEIDDALISRDDLAARLPDLLTEDYPAERAAADTRGLIAIGLLPEGSDLLQLSLDLLGEQVAGFYDPKTDEMFVISDQGEFGPLEEFTYAHEVIHALQDAHLDLDGLTEASLAMDADAATALAALFEGDATVASFDYLMERPTLARDIAFSASAPSDQMDSAPGALTVSMVFPYLAGERFVQALRDQGGWEAVDAAYESPPASTEQVMHPEKYLAGEGPVPVALPDLGPALGAGWEPVVEDVMGELGVALLLADLQPGEGIHPFTGELDLPIPAANAAAGWSGDRYALWADGDREVLVWRSAWDSERDASAFMRALAQFTERRRSAVFAGETGNDVALVGDGVAVRLALVGDEVLFVQAPDMAAADAAMQALRAA